MQVFSESILAEPHGVTKFADTGTPSDTIYGHLRVVRNLFTRG